MEVFNYSNGDGENKERDLLQLEGGKAPEGLRVALVSRDLPSCPSLACHPPVAHVHPFGGCCSSVFIAIDTVTPLIPRTAEYVRR